jgi:opacity protein-like surface antigen
MAKLPGGTFCVHLKGGMRMRSIILALLFVALLAVPVLDQARAEEKTWEDWNFNVDLYLFVAGASGDATITVEGDGMVQMPVDIDFRDFADNYKGGVIGMICAKKKRWSVNLDLSYAKLEADQSVTPPGGGGTTVDAKNKLTLNENEIFLGYQISDPDQGVSEVIVGARYLSQDIKLEAKSAADDLDMSTDNSWWMGFLGARYMGPLAGSETWSLLIRADAGIADLSGRFAWRANIGTSWMFAENWDLVLMYKWLGIDYVKGEAGDSDYYAYKATQHGPVVGVGVKF